MKLNHKKMIHLFFQYSLRWVLFCFSATHYDTVKATEHVQFIIDPYLYEWWVFYNFSSILVGFFLAPHPLVIPV